MGRWLSFATREEFLLMSAGQSITHNYCQRGRRCDPFSLSLNLPFLEAVQLLQASAGDRLDGSSGTILGMPISLHCLWGKVSGRG